MATEFVQSGYIEVWRDGALVSRHRVEREAVESALAHSESRGDGDYELRFPPVKVIVRRTITAPDAPALDTPVPTGETTMNVGLSRPATGPTTISSYYLERCSDYEELGENSTGSWAVIASGLTIFGSMNVYNDSGLTNGTTYYYRLRAVDTTERYSQYSAVVSATTSAVVSDTTAPTVPTSLTATQAESGVILLSWVASTDAVGVVNYDVLRGIGDGSGNVVGTGAVIATVTGTSYSDSTVVDDQEYYYRVSAKDAAGNASAYTARVFITPSPVAGGGVALDYNEGFETNLGAFFTSTAGAAIVEVNATRAREGTKSLLTHCPNPTVWRAEVSLGYGGCVPMQQATWYGWSVYADDNWVGDFNTWEAFGQWHTRDDSMSPPIAFETGYRAGYGTGNLLFRVSWASAAPPTSFTGNQIWNLGRMDDLKGQWLDFVMYVVPSSTTTGQLRLWMNGTEVATRLNAPNYVNDVIGPYWKMGIYNGWRYGDATPGVTERKAWWDNYRQVTDPAAVYSDVAPR